MLVVFVANLSVQLVLTQPGHLNPLGAVSKFRMSRYRLAVLVSEPNRVIAAYSNRAAMTLHCDGANASRVGDWILRRAASDVIKLKREKKVSNTVLNFFVFVAVFENEALCLTRNKAYALTEK